jgi:hypothetical protein
VYFPPSPPLAQYAPGSVVTWWGISSCTKDVQVARQFMRVGCGGGGTLVKVVCRSSTAISVSELSLYSHEGESLLLPGTRLRVVARMPAAPRTGTGAGTGYAQVELHEV